MTSNKIIKKRINPFFKWVGGKRGMLKKIIPLLPKNFNNYYEPFVGGGAVFFHLNHKRSSISDINRDVISAYKAVRSNVHELIKLLYEHKKNSCQEYFLKVRSMNDLENDIEIAGRFMYLNRASYRGLYRLNKEGNFNSAYGHGQDKIIIDEANLLAVSKVLQGVDIAQCSFEKIAPKEGDFVYIDPPYHNSKHTYTAEIFNVNWQIKLKNFCDKLNDDGVIFMASNANTDFINDLYSKYKKYSFEIASTLDDNSNFNRRSELIVTNY